MKRGFLLSAFSAAALMCLSTVPAGAVGGTGPPTPGGGGGCSGCGVLTGGGTAPWSYNCAGWGMSGGKQIANEYVWPEGPFGLKPTLAQLGPHVWSPSNPTGTVFEIYGPGLPPSLGGTPPGLDGTTNSWGGLNPYFPDYGCVKGSFVPPTLSIPPFSAQGVNPFPNATITTNTGPADLVEDPTTGAAGPCPTVSPLPTLPPTIPPTVQYFYSPGATAASTCPKSIVIWGQVTSGGETASILIEEQMHLVSYTGCSSADPYQWNFDYGGTSISPAPVFCAPDSTSYTYTHVVNNTASSPGVRIEALSSWQPECSGVVVTFTGATVPFANLTGPANTVGPGVTINCDPEATQTYGPTVAKAVDQIESIANG